MKTAMYFIQEHLHKQIFHGGIGLVDIEKILVRQGYSPINFPSHHDFTLKGKFYRFRYLLHVLASIRPGSLIVFQFPLYARMNMLLLRLLQLKKSVTVICLITDINGLKDGNEKLLKREIIELQRYRYFIVHNQHMQQWLTAHVMSKKISRLIFFDFLAPVVIKKKAKSNTIVFAGNLEKSLFLEQLGVMSINRLKFNLYGPNVTDAMRSQKNVVYKGVYDPGKLPGIIEGSFGLVWDGDGIEGPLGNFGHYMQYISHHKLSLYILAKLPIIVYENAGSAEFVQSHRLGITIRNLHEIQDKIDALSEAAYQTMVENLNEYALKISTGKCLKEAIENVMPSEKGL